MTRDTSHVTRHTSHVSDACVAGGGEEWALEVWVGGTGGGGDAFEFLVGAKGPAVTDAAGGGGVLGVAR